ncbi:hypothetical protein [Streptomyces sp. NPDC055085]
MDIPDDLINGECAAEQERARMAGLSGDAYEAQWQAWCTAVQKVQAGIAALAEATAADARDIEQAVKKAARRTSEDPAD